MEQRFGVSLHAARRLAGELMEVVDQMHLIVIAELMGDANPRFSG